jgi:Na+-transporting NADH:ubiquinone oxidoreductase subunit C
VKDSLYALAYAAVLGAVCALLLTAAAGVTAPYRQANAEAEETLNILMVLNVPLEADTSAKQLGEVFKNNLREAERGGVTTYLYSSPEAQGRIQAIALRFSGPGLWGPIKGFLALERDMKTIRGITFYEQEETPGLGGDIVTEGFRKRFVGKTIHDKDDNVGIVICKPGTAKEQNEIDGITGATMTCDKVQAMLNEVIKSIVEEKQ